MLLADTFLARDDLSMLVIICPQPAPLPSQCQRTGSHSTCVCCNAYGLYVVTVPQIPIWACCTLFGTSFSVPVWIPMTPMTLIFLR